MTKAAFYAIFMEKLRQFFQERINWYYYSCRPESALDAFDEESLYIQLSMVPSLARDVGFSKLLVVDGVDANERFWNEMPIEIFEIVIGVIEDAFVSTKLAIAQGNNYEVKGLDDVAMDAIYIEQSKNLLAAARFSPFQVTPNGTVLADHDDKAAFNKLSQLLIRPKIATTLLLTKLFPTFPDSEGVNPNEEGHRDRTGRADGYAPRHTESTQSGLV